MTSTAAPTFTDCSAGNVVGGPDRNAPEIPGRWPPLRVEPDTQPGFAYAARRISDAVVEVVRGVRAARPAWVLRPVEAAPEMVGVPYVVFAGNVGGDDDLAHVIDVLRGRTQKQG